MDDEEPFQDSDSEYLPTRSPSPNASDLLDNLGAENQSPNSVYGTASPQNDEEKQKPRKRIRQPSNWKRNIRMVKRAKGEQYINTKNKIVPAKKNKHKCSMSMWTKMP